MDSDKLPAFPQEIHQLLEQQIEDLRQSQKLQMDEYIKDQFNCLREGLLRHSESPLMDIFESVSSFKLIQKDEELSLLNDQIATLNDHISRERNEKEMWKKIAEREDVVVKKNDDVGSSIDVDQSGKQFEPISPCRLCGCSKICMSLVSCSHRFCKQCISSVDGCPVCRSQMPDSIDVNPK